MRLAPLALLLSSCSGAPVVYNPSEPVPTAVVEGVVNAEGKGDVRVDSAVGPLATLYAWEGNVTLRIRSERPWLVFEQNFTDGPEEAPEVIDDIIIEPSEGNEDAALDALNRGDVEIRRKDGSRTLNARGSIAARKARTFPPPTPAVSSVTEFPPCPPGMECIGGVCRVPPPVEIAQCAR